MKHFNRVRIRISQPLDTNLRDQPMSDVLIVQNTKAFQQRREVGEVRGQDPICPVTDQWHHG